MNWACKWQLLQNFLYLGYKEVFYIIEAVLSNIKSNIKILILFDCSNIKTNL